VKAEVVQFVPKARERPSLGPLRTTDIISDRRGFGVRRRDQQREGEPPEEGPEAA
jgi:hypothetical protein